MGSIPWDYYLKGPGERSRKLAKHQARSTFKMDEPALLILHVIAGLYFYYPLHKSTVNFQKHKTTYTVGPCLGFCGPDGPTKDEANGS